MTADKWPREKLGKLVDVKGGKRLPAGAAFSTDPTDHPYIRGQDIRNGRIRIGEPLFVTEAVFQKISRYTVDAGDVCVTIVGNIGDVGITPAELAGANLTENAVKLIPLVHSLDRRYLAYALLSPNAQEQMKLSAAGAAQPKLGIYKVNEIEIPVPDTESQHRIASILSAYDELIENNTRRIAILEEMARRIYEEWFVRFRFPGHENVRMVESELGLVPDGWTREVLADCAHITMGQSPSSEFYNDGGDGLPFHQGVTNFGAHYPSHKQYCSVEGRLAQEGDILVSVRAPVGRINLSPSKLVIGRGLCAVRSKSGNQVFLLHRLLETFKEEDSMGNGAIFKAVSKQEVLGLPFLRPNGDLADHFEKLAAPLWELIKNLTAKNTNLRTTRDLLLPKLISGELDVSAAPEPEAAVA